MIVTTCHQKKHRHSRRFRESIAPPAKKISSFPRRRESIVLIISYIPASSKIMNTAHQKNAVIPWLDHGTQVIKSDCYNNAFT